MQLQSAIILFAVISGTPVDHSPVPLDSAFASQTDAYYEHSAYASPTTDAYYSHSAYASQTDAYYTSAASPTTY